MAVEGNSLMRIRWKRPDLKGSIGHPSCAAKRLAGQAPHPDKTGGKVQDVKM
jgi:hypothetical protein